MATTRFMACCRGCVLASCACQPERVGTPGCFSVLVGFHSVITQRPGVLDHSPESFRLIRINSKDKGGVGNQKQIRHLSTVVRKNPTNQLYFPATLSLCNLLLLRIKAMPT